MSWCATTAMSQSSVSTPTLVREINPHRQINHKHVDVHGRWGIYFSHLYCAVGILRRHHDALSWRRGVSRVYLLENAMKALEDVEERRVVKALIAPRTET